MARTLVTWKLVVVFMLVAAAGVALGSAARMYSAPPALDPIAEASRRGSGELLIEFFDPSCGHSRKLHAELEAIRSVTHVLVPVATGRGHRNSLAAALCASEPATIWSTALAWSRRPPAIEDLLPDPERLARCVSLVAAAAGLLSNLPGIEGQFVTPVVQFRGKVYIGSTSINELRALLEGAQQ